MFGLKIRIYRAGYPDGQGARIMKEEQWYYLENNHIYQQGTSGLQSLDIIISDAGWINDAIF